MLKSITSQAKYCYERARQAKQRAFETADPQVREEFAASEARWLKLAQSYELSDRVNRFLRRPAACPEHPVCADCNIPMWLVEIQSSLEQRVFVYECKICGTQQSLTETDG